MRHYAHGWQAACASYLLGSFMAMFFGLEVFFQRVSVFRGMSAMGTLKFLVVAVVFCSASLAAPLAAQDQPLARVGALDQVVSKVTAREKQEMQMIRQHSPLVETYIQKVRVTENDGSWVPDGDHYFIGRADFAKGLDLKPLPAPGDTA